MRRITTATRSSTVRSVVAASARYHSVVERLHYAVDTEFIKTGGDVMARSIAFVPFVAVEPAVEEASSTGAGVGALQTQSVPDRLALTGGRPRSAAVRAALARHRPAPQPEQPTAPATPSTCMPRPQRRGIPADALTPHTIVVAMRHGGVLEHADLLPCGHAFGHLLPRPAVPAAVFSPPLDPFHIPNIQRHREALLGAWRGGAEGTDVLAACDRLLVPAQGRSKKGRALWQALRSAPNCTGGGFASEGALVSFLEACHATSSAVLRECEPRYTTNIDIAVPPGQLQLADGDPRLGAWYIGPGPQRLRHLYLLCDTVEELGVLLSCVWQALLVQMGRVAAATGGGPAAASAASSASLTGSSASAGAFYAYGPFDNAVIRSTLLAGAAVDTAARERLLQRADVTDVVRAVAGGAGPDAAVQCLTSPFSASVRDVTQHSLFRGCGLVNSKRHTPKLIDALHVVATTAPEAFAMLNATINDSHNPLWDAQALATICTYILRLRHSHAPPTIQ